MEVLGWTINRRPGKSRAFSLRHSVRLQGEERTYRRSVTIIYRGPVDESRRYWTNPSRSRTKLQIQHAGQAYVRDQASRSKSAFVSYLVGACFLLGAAIFAVVAILIGAAALFRFIEMRYGLFEAFGVAGGAMFVVALICLVIGLTKMKVKSKNVVPLASRFRVAAHSHPITRENFQDAAVALIDRKHRSTTFGLALAGAFLGYLVLRRR